MERLGVITWNITGVNLNVDFEGKEIGMQAAYLSRIFREEDTQLAIPEIAERTGFFSANVFDNNFKKLTGVTPGKYRVSMENICPEQEKC